MLFWRNPVEVQWCLLCARIIDVREQVDGEAVIAAVHMQVFCRNKINAWPAPDLQNIPSAFDFYQVCSALAWDQIFKSFHSTELTEDGNRIQSDKQAVRIFYKTMIPL